MGWEEISFQKNMDPPLLKENLTLYLNKIKQKLSQVSTSMPIKVWGIFWFSAHRRWFFWVKSSWIYLCHLLAFQVMNFSSTFRDGSNSQQKDIVRELDLDFTPVLMPGWYFPRLYELPRCLFSCDSLTTLKLSDCKLKLPLWFTGSISLKTLHLNRVEITCYAIGWNTS